MGGRRGPFGMLEDGGQIPSSDALRVPAMLTHCGRPITSPVPPHRGPAPPGGGGSPLLPGGAFHRCPGCASPCRGRGTEMRSALAVQALRRIENETPRVLLRPPLAGLVRHEAALAIEDL